MRARLALALALAASLSAPETAARTRVAILDGGVDAAHPALAGHVVRDRDFAGGGAHSAAALEHGTLMAILVLGRDALSFVGRDLDVLPLRVVRRTRGSDGGAVEPGPLARAIRHAVARGAGVILVGSGSAVLDPALADAVALAEARGIPVVAPAGGSSHGAMLYPAALPGVISVAAAGDEPGPRRATAVAPGRCAIASLMPADTLVRHGSSIAAARVAGVVAGLLAHDPGLAPAGIRAAIRDAFPPGANDRAAEPSAALRSVTSATRSARTLRPGGETRGRLQYADRAGTDVVMDAPWRSVRDYIPVLFLFPQFDGGRRVERIRILECSAGVPVGRAIVVDAAAGPDTLNSATFVGPLGETRSGLEATERVTDFWHYIVRVPHGALSLHSVPDIHELRAEVEWTRPGLRGRTTFRNHRVLRVVVDARQFPSFAPEDRYLDTHHHTIAEQTRAGVLDVDGASKAFAAPIVMLLESAYALGLVQTRPASGNWSAFRDSLAVTDHNLFYSREPYDTGTAPGFGPTATSDGHAGEAAWYRTNLGRLAGEEITLRRGSNQDGSVTPNLGHHLLAYDTRHFEGPWHGGRFLTSRLENPNTLESVLAAMKAAGPDGFVYASHPNLDGFVWPPEYFAQAIGLPPHNSVTAPGTDSARGEFLFKGSEVWNTKLDQVASDSGHLPASDAFDAMNPFPGGPEAQRFRPVAWAGELVRSLDTFHAQLGHGLRFSFREAPRERFIRKLYMSAGSDAHGDFNYTDEVSATAVPWSGLLHANADARVRTYTLAHDRTASDRSAVAAFRDGNTVLTDGPLARVHLDADGRHDPGSGVARWHDASSSWQNEDGGIGGEGRYDGGRTLLVPFPGDDVWIRSQWLRSVTPGAGDLTRLQVVRVMAGARDSLVVRLGSEGLPDHRRLPQAMDSLAARVATTRDLGADERCILNPVWVAPVRIEVSARRAGADASSATAVAPGGLRVVFEFPISMRPDGATRAFVRPLDARGNSSEPEIELVADPGWAESGGVAAGRYSVTNAAALPVSPGEWDAGSHRASPGAHSYVVYLKAPADLHGNVLNDIARAFALPAAR